MAPFTEKRATLDDLYRAEGKAELINGRIDHIMASGASVNASTTSVGADDRFDPAAGCEDARRACAIAGDARPMATTSPAPAAASRRKRGACACRFMTV